MNADLISYCAFQGDGLVCVKTSQAALIAVYQSPTVPGEAAKVVEGLGTSFPTRSHRRRFHTNPTLCECNSRLPHRSRLLSSSLLALFNFSYLLQGVCRDPGLEFSLRRCNALVRSDPPVGVGVAGSSATDQARLFVPACSMISFRPSPTSTFRADRRLEISVRNDQGRLQEKRGGRMLARLMSAQPHAQMVSQDRHAKRCTVVALARWRRDAERTNLRAQRNCEMKCHLE